MDVRVVSSPPVINAALAERSSTILVIWNTEIRVLQAAPSWRDGRNGIIAPVSNTGGVGNGVCWIIPSSLRQQRRDDGISKRTRLESEGGKKTHARSERALSAMV